MSSPQLKKDLMNLNIKLQLSCNYF